MITGAIISLFIYSTANAQVVKYKAVIFTTLKYKGEDVKPPLQGACDFLVVLNLNKLKINLYSNKEQEFDIVKKGEVIKGNKVITHQYSCVDSDGEKCLVGFGVYEEGNAYSAALIVDYGETVYAYYMKDD